MHAISVYPTLCNSSTKTALALFDRFEFSIRIKNTKKKREKREKKPVYKDIEREKDLWNSSINSTDKVTVCSVSSQIRLYKLS